MTDVTVWLLDARLGSYVRVIHQEMLNGNNIPAKKKKFIIIDSKFSIIHDFHRPSRKFSVYHNTQECNYSNHRRTIIRNI